MSASIEPTDRGFTAEDGGTTLSVEFCAPGIVRVRKWQGPEPPTGPLIRYGF